MKRRSQRFMIVLILAVVTTALIVAGLEVKNLQSELSQYDEAIFNRIEQIQFEGDVKEYLSHVDSLINYRDCVIVVNSINEVTGSLGVVVGEMYEDIVHKKVEFTGDRIILDASSIGLNTSVSKINVRMKNTYNMYVNDDFELYYIPSWRIRGNHILLSVLKGISVAAFVGSLAIALLVDDIDKMIKDEKDELTSL